VQYQGAIPEAVGEEIPWSQFYGDPRTVGDIIGSAESQVANILSDELFVKSLPEEAWQLMRGGLDHTDSVAARKMFMQGSKIINDDLRQAQKGLSEANKALREARRDGRKLRNGELQFKLSTGETRYASSKEILEQWVPDGVVNNFEIQKSLLTREQLSHLDKAWRHSIRNEVPEGTSKALSFFLKQTDRLAAVNGLMRTLRSTYDFGAMNIHLLPLLWHKPDVWGRAVKVGAQSFFDGKASQRFLAEHIDTFERMNATGQLGPASVEFVQEASRVRRAFTEDIPGFIPLPGVQQAGNALGRTTKAFEDGYTGMLLGAKILMFESLEGTVKNYADELLKNGRAMEILGRFGVLEGLEENAEAFAKSDAGIKLINQYVETEITQHIAKLTGSMDLAGSGMSKSVQSVMGGFVFFAPRYRMSAYGMILDATRGGIRGELSRKALGNFMTGGLLTYVAIGMRIGQEPNLDPTSGKFMTYEIDGVNVGFGGAYMAMSRVAAHLYKNVDEAQSGDVGWMTMLNPVDRDSWLQKTLRGQSSPITGLAWDTFSERTYMGEPLEGNWGKAKNAVRSSAVPFWADTFFETPSAGITGALTEFTGFRTYPTSLWERSVDMMNIAMARDDMYLDDSGNPVQWEDLTGLQKARARDKYGEIDAQMIESENLWNRRSSGLDEKVSDYRSALAKIRRSHIDDIEELNAGLKNGSINTRQYRSMRAQYIDARSKRYAQVKEEHAEANEELTEIYKTELRDMKLGKKIEFIGDIAYLEYLMEVTLNPELTKPFDEYDYDLAAKKIDAFKARWDPDGSNDVYRYVLARQQSSYENMPMEHELRQGTTAFRPYFEVGKAILERTGEKDKIRIWTDYERARARKARGFDVDRDFYQEYPWIKEIERAEEKVKKVMRERNSVLERWLYRWGYLDPSDPFRNLHNVQNQNTNPEDLIRTPISPQEIIDSVQTTTAPPDVPPVQVPQAPVAPAPQPQPSPRQPDLYRPA